MKKIISLFLAAALFAAILSSCGAGDADALSEYVTPGALAVTAAELDPETVSAAAYKNVVFALFGDTVSRLDLSAGGSDTVLSGVSALSIGCSGSKLVLVDENEIRAFDFDGNPLSSVSFEFKIKSVRDVSVCGNSAAFSADGEIYIADFDKKTVTALDNNWKCGAKDADALKISLTPKNTLLALFSYNKSIAGSDYKAVEVDIKNSEILLEMPAEMAAKDGCFGSEGNLYYPLGCTSGSRTDASWKQFISMLSRDGTVSNVMLTDGERLAELGFEPENIYSETFSDALGQYQFVSSLDSYSLIYGDGESFVLWDITAGKIAAFSNDTGLESLVVLAPDNPLITRKLNDAAVNYSAKTGRQVLLSVYPEEEFNERLSTKLLAGDSDFDLFIADGEILRNVLENSAYLPLDGYPEIISDCENVLADGVKGLITSKDGSIFGIPLGVSYWGVLKEVEESGIPEAWTVSDLFDFCDQIPSGKKVFGDRYMLTQTVENIVEDMILNDGKIDENELTETFKKFKEYNDQGVLCDGEKSEYLSYGTLFFDADELKIQITEQDGPRMICVPTRSGTNYVGLNLTLMIGRSSKNPDASAEFAEFFASEDYVYQNSGHNLVIGREIEKNSSWNDLNAYQQELLRYSMKQFKNSKPQTLGSVPGFTQFITDSALFPMLDGEISPEEAAKMISEQISYAYFE